MRKIRILISFLALSFATLCLSGCGIIDDFGDSGTTSLSYSNVSLQWNFVSDYYYIQATISNYGTKDANGVTVYYYYTDNWTGIKYEKTAYIGTIEAGESVVFKSNNIYDSHGAGVVNYGISKVN